MDSVNLEVLRRAVAWIEAGIPATLATVVKTWGSAPRAEGALLAISADGQLVGSVSGGCIEDDLLVRLRAMQPERPELVVYGVSAEQTRRFGLPCGGTLQLVLEPLTSASGLRRVLDAVQAGQLVARQLQLKDGSTRVTTQVPDAAVVFDGQTLVSAFGPRWRMLIIGGGQLAHYLAQFALALDYQVFLSEPREEYRASWTLPQVTVLTDMPDDAVQALQPDRRTVVIAAAHDPKLDDLALIDALKTEAFYVGAIGSRANSERRRERLRLFDLTDAELDRLHGPVGLAMGSRTPPEIALSVVADITARRNGVQLVAQTHPTRAPSTLCPTLVA